MLRNPNTNHIERPAGLHIKSYFQKKRAEIYTDPGEYIHSDGDMSEEYDFVDTKESSVFITPKVS